MNIKEGEYWLAQEIPFQKVSELQDDGHEVRFQTKGWLRRTSTYSEFWKKKLSGRAGPIAEKAGNILPIKVKWQVTMPGKIQESNADEIKEGVAVWNLTLTDFAAQHSFSARSTHWNIPALAVITIAALFLFTLLFVVYRKNAGGKRTQCVSGVARSFLPMQIFAANVESPRKNAMKCFEPASHKKLNEHKNTERHSVFSFFCCVYQCDNR